MLETLLMWYIGVVILSWVDICKEVWEAYTGQIYLSRAELLGMVIVSFIPIVNLGMVLDLFTPVLNQVDNILAKQLFKGKKK